MSEQHIYPVCGLPGFNEAPYDDFGKPSFDICPCCGNEFGYDDLDLSLLELRKKWIEGGCQWQGREKPPQGWDPKKQLEDAGFTKQSAK